MNAPKAEKIPKRDMFLIELYATIETLGELFAFLQ